jgi:hypothetical protein
MDLLKRTRFGSVLAAYGVLHPGRLDETALSRLALWALARVCFRALSLDPSTSLPPLAPRALPRFIATMEALTPLRRSIAAGVSLIHVTPCRPLVALTRPT